MKQNMNGYEGQSWRWPQSTWLQKRLSALKAQEDAARQKQPRTPEKAAAEPQSPDLKATKEL